MCSSSRIGCDEGAWRSGSPRTRRSGRRRANTPLAVPRDAAQAVSARTEAAATPEFDPEFVYAGVEFPAAQEPRTERRPEGKFSFEAHRAVKGYQKCYLTNLEFVGKEAGEERYTVGCHDRTQHEVRCDLERCLAKPKQSGG